MKCWGCYEPIQPGGDEAHVCTYCGGRNLRVRPQDPWGDDFFLPACLIAALMIAMFLISWSVASDGERATTTVDATSANEARETIR